MYDNASIFSINIKFFLKNILTNAKKCANLFIQIIQINVLFEYKFRRRIMIKHIKTIAFTVALLMIFGVFSACGKQNGGDIDSGNVSAGDLAIDDNFACTITVDGGGQWANFNTTSSMEETDSNPYPYNTLETLAKEYMALHKNVKIELLTSSYNGARDQILPMLSTKTAPDILFQVPTTLAEDCNKKYYAALDEYLKLPNPYSAEGEKGSEKWIDVYPEGEYKPTVDGHYYFAAMDRSAIGIIYNKTFFTQHNIAIPTTYSEFLQTIETIHTTDAGKTPYMANGGNMWLDITIEAAVFYGIKDELDVITKDGKIDAHEIVAAYENGKIDPNGDRYKEYMRLIQEKTKYSPNPQTAVLKNEFMLGNVVMGEADGNTISYLMNNVDDFEVGVFPYPIIDKASSSYVVEGTGTRRGSSGLTSAWFITNHAFSSSSAEENRKKVNACADFLMFLTAKKNNDRMINDKKVSIPLSGNGYGKNDCLKSLVEVYNEDMTDENMYDWAFFNPSGTLTKAYYDVFYIAYHNFVYGNTSKADKGNTTAFAQSMINGLDQASLKLKKLNKWS